MHKCIVFAVIALLWLVLANLPSFANFKKISDNSSLLQNKADASSNNSRQNNVADNANGPSIEEIIKALPHYVDTIGQAKLAGYDYISLVKKCAQKDKDALCVFFKMSSKNTFDGAGSEGHAEVTGALLKKLGDDFFGSLLAKENKKVRNQVRKDILFDLGYGDDKKNDKAIMATLQKEYPKTFPKKWNPKEQ